MQHYDYSGCDAGVQDDDVSLPSAGSAVQSQPVHDSIVSPRGKRPSELDLAASTPDPDGKFLTVSQAALALGISPRRVRALVAAGWLRAERVNPRLLRIRRSDLRAVKVRLPGRPRK